MVLEDMDSHYANATEPVVLCTFRPPLTPAQTLERTASYARDAVGYLEKTLGCDSFTQRKHAMILPAAVDFDIYGHGKHRENFESSVAGVLGKNHGLFFHTGTQAQLAALKVHADRAGSNKVAWHITSHLETAEEKAYCRLYGLERILLSDDATRLPSTSDIMAILQLPPAERPAAMLLEIPERTLGCVTYSFEQLKEISAACEAANVALHCDGARLWEIEPFYRAQTGGSSFADIVALFSSAYVSFYKGLGGVTGAMLVHNDGAFLDQARVWQKRAGGCAFTLGFEVLDCERGFNETIGTFGDKRLKMIRLASKITKETAMFRCSGGARIVTFQPEIPTCAQVLTFFQGFSREQLVLARDKVQERIKVRVFERLRPNQTMDDISRDARRSRLEGEQTRPKATSESRHFIEWRITSLTMDVHDDLFVAAYVAFCQELMALPVDTPLSDLPSRTCATSYLRDFDLSRHLVTCKTPNV